MFISAANNDDLLKLISADTEIMLVIMWILSGNANNCVPY